MTITEKILVALIWLCLGLFICYKAKWYKHKDLYNRVGDDDGFLIFACWVTVFLAPIIFTFDFINRFFVKEWHED